MKVISMSEAARRLGCARSTLYRAAERGEIHTMHTGSATVIIVDEAWEEYEPNMTGGRAAKFKPQDDGNDDSE